MMCHMLTKKAQIHSQRRIGRKPLSLSHTHMRAQSSPEMMSVSLLSCGLSLLHDILILSSYTLSIHPVLLYSPPPHARTHSLHPFFRLSLCHSMSPALRGWATHHHIALTSSTQSIQQSGPGCSSPDPPSTSSWAIAVLNTPDLYS